MTFSIIVPLYKQGYKTLDKFFMHLNEQDYKKFEVILAYNSPDENTKKATQRILKSKIVKKMTIIEVDAGYDEKLGRGNHCRAFNKGAEIASGEYLLFLDPDVYLYPGILREYKDAFDSSKADFVYGDYDFDNNAGRISGRKYSEYELKCANYISGAFPIKKSYFKGWDENLQSLQDWDMRLNAVDAGATGFYIGRPCFTTDMPQPDGISSHSAKNWIETWSKIREKHNFPVSKIAVTSLGAPMHATRTAEILGVDTRVQSNIVNFKEHNYETIYLLGFYPLAWQAHLGLFYKNGVIIDGELSTKKRVIHFIGTDIFQFQHKLSWSAWKNMLQILNAEEMDFRILCECEQTQKELSELNIKADIVPIPPTRLYDPITLPKEFTIGVYTNPTQDMYFENFMYEIADAMPDIKFKFFGTESMKGKVEDNKEWMGWVNMDEFLPTISAMVRLTVHDGLPLGPIEAMTMGRNVLTSMPLKHGLVAEYAGGEPIKEDIVEKIRQLQEMPCNVEGANYWKKELSHDLYKERIQKYV